MTGMVATNPMINNQFVGQGGRQRRSPWRPGFSSGSSMVGQVAPVGRNLTYHVLQEVARAVIARSEATKQSPYSATCLGWECFPRITSGVTITGFSTFCETNLSYVLVFPFTSILRFSDCRFFLQIQKIRSRLHYQLNLQYFFYLRGQQFLSLVETRRNILQLC